MSANPEKLLLSDKYVSFQHDLGKPVEDEFFIILKELEMPIDRVEEPAELEYRGNKRNSDNEIYRRRLGDEDIWMLYNILKDQSQIVGLHLDYNCIGDVGAETLGQLLQDTKVLKTLSLMFNDFGPKGAEAIAKGLQMNESLRSLKLDGNKIKCKGGMSIAAALQVNNVLQELTLSYTDLKIDSIIAFCTVLSTHSSLAVINLDRPLLPNMQDDAVVHIANMLKVNKSLRELHIGKHGINNFGAERLVESLWSNDTLQHLDLNGNRISRDGAVCIADLLKQNTPLQVLNLAYNRIEDAGAIAIAEALRTTNFNLRSLAVCYNEIGEDGLCSLADALTSNAGVESIYLWGNKVTTAVSKAFEALTAEPSPRISQNNTDVRSYVVDDSPYLSRLPSSHTV